jgi:hypothetical protein
VFLSRDSVEIWKEFLAKVFYGKDFTAKVVLKFENSSNKKELNIETTGMIPRGTKKGPLIAIANDITEKRLMEDTRRRLDRSLSAQQSYSTRNAHVFHEIRLKCTYSNPQLRTRSIALTSALFIIIHYDSLCPLSSA